MNNLNSLPQVSANFASLTPLNFLKHSAMLYPQKLAIAYGSRRLTWKETYLRCCQLANALQQHGITKGDTVAMLCPNIPEHFEAHFGVPMCGAVLNSINTRLDAATIAFILQHANAKVLMIDKEFSNTVKEVLRLLNNPDLLVIDIIDPTFTDGEYLGSISYDDFIAKGDPNVEWQVPENEWDAISLNYTSGTTGDPKGVVYHHRGAYLNALSNALSWHMPTHAIYLWTLPMFHCNGWCFPWTLASVAGVSICLRHVRADDVVRLIQQERVDHLCGAPIVLSMIAANEKAADIKHTVKVMVAGAPPPASVIGRMEALGFKITHTYGLTETYGPCVVCAWHDEWQHESPAEQARLKARQGVPVILQDCLMVADPETMQPVAKDGISMGEIMIRGNIVMKGYLKNPKTTDAAFADGWFHTGDLAVWHADNYVEIKDRAKDIIISGGENISSIELEEVLMRHPNIVDVAVVAKPDEKWGEVPCAFVKLAPNTTLTASEVIAYCREHTAHFKVPKHVVFLDLPRTPTGKVQKYMLRKMALEV